MKTTVSIEGLADLQASLRELPKATRRNAGKRALIKAARPMAEEAQRRAPVLFGDLRDSITSGRPLARRQRRLQVRFADVEVFVGAGQNPQATLQEFGSVNNPPQPFMRPAFDNNVRGAITTIRDVLGDEIQKAAKRIARKQARLIAKTGGG